MRRDNLSYLENRVDPAQSGFFTFHYPDTDEEFGIGTMDEFIALKNAGIIDPSAVARAA